MITDIPLVLRLQKNAPLTAAEVDNNFDNLRKAILALSQQTTQRVVIGAEPPAGERDGVLWVPADYRAIYVWDSANGKWVRMTEPTLYAVATSTGNAYEITLPGDYADIAAITGKIIAFKASGSDNTGASTLKVNAFTPQAIKKDGTVDVAGGQIKPGRIYLVVYDGTNFQILNPTDLPPSGPTYWTSALLDIPTPGTALLTPHTFPKLPELVRCVLVCVDGTGVGPAGPGYQLNDEVDSTSFGADLDGGHEDTPAFTVACDATQFIIGTYTCNNELMYVDKTGVPVKRGLAVVQSKFKMKLYVMLFP